MGCNDPISETLALPSGNAIPSPKQTRCCLPAFCNFVGLPLNGTSPPVTSSAPGVSLFVPPPVHSSPVLLMCKKTLCSPSCVLSLSPSDPIWFSTPLLQSHYAQMLFLVSFSCCLLLCQRPSWDCPLCPAVPQAFPCTAAVCSCTLYIIPGWVAQGCLQTYSHAGDFLNQMNGFTEMIPSNVLHSQHLNQCSQPTIARFFPPLLLQVQVIVGHGCFFF